MSPAPRNGSNGPPDCRPWFRADEGPAVEDFWQVYQERFDELEQPSGDDRERIRAVLSEAIRTGDFGPYEEILVRRAQREGAAEDEVVQRVRLLTAHLVRAYNDTPDRLVAVLDVLGEFLARSTAVLAGAAHEAYEAALRRSERSLATTLESIGDGVIATDARGRIELMNPVAQQLTRWSLEEAAGCPLDQVFQVVDEDTGEVVPCGLEDLLGSAVVPTPPRHSSLVAKDGRVCPISDTVSPIRDSEGAIRGVVVVFRDLTREREHERAMADSHQQLRSLAKWVEASREEERTRIARELHDELGQNLTATRMDIGWLVPRLREAPPEVTERLHAMSAIIDSIFKMVRRIGTDLRPGVLDDLGLPDAIEWQAAEFERRSGIKVDMDVSPELADIDRARSTALFRMFQEMLTNVARHAKAQKVVGRLSLEDDRVTLEVTDDGRGILEKELTNSKSLGLLGMRERAAMHGGTFSIRRRSRTGGTVVTVALPRDEEVTS